MKKKSRQSHAIYLADLTHTGQGINADNFPLGIGLVAANIKKEFEDFFDISIFKFPELLNKKIRLQKPQVLCLSNYSWNERLGLKYAGFMKSIACDTIVIMGGPNFPLSPVKRAEFLKKNSDIDFYVKWDGEKAAVELLKVLAEANFNVTRIKKSNLIINNVCYLNADADYVEGADDRLSNIEEMPSPYTMGLLDEFFDDFFPLFETTRGCPYGCTFCNDGTTNRNKIYRSGEAKFQNDLEYAAKRAKNGQIFLSDLNFGMYREDIAISKIIAKIITKYDWPNRLETSTGKAQPHRLIETNDIINSVKPGVLKLGYSFQSTDSEVLAAIKRKNLSVEQLETMREHFKSRQAENLEFFTELILAMPGDTYEKFKKSLRDVTDSLQANNIDAHQLTLLKGSVMDTEAQRTLYEFKPKYRVYVGCMGTYPFGDHLESVYEVEEVVVENNTFPFKDIVKARILHLLVKIYIDHNPFIELFSYLTSLGISAIDVLDHLQNQIIPKDKKFLTLINSFKDGMQMFLFETEEDLDRFVLKDNNIEKYMSGELGANELLVHRARAFTEFNDTIHDCLTKAILSYPRSEGSFSKLNESYVKECIHFSNLRKFSLKDIEIKREGVFHFDFDKAKNNAFVIDPNEIQTGPKKYEFYYEEDEIKKLRSTFGSLEGLSMKRLGKLYQRVNFMKYDRQFKIETASENLLLD